MATRTGNAARDVLAIEEAEAWHKYLEDTKDLGGRRYNEIEDWAWAKLQVRLRAVEARKTAIK